MHVFGCVFWKWMHLDFDSSWSNHLISHSLVFSCFYTWIRRTQQFPSEDEQSFHSTPEALYLQWEQELIQSQITLICAAWQPVPIDRSLNTDSVASRLYVLPFHTELQACNSLSGHNVVKQCKSLQLTVTVRFILYLIRSQTKLKKPTYTFKKWSSCESTLTNNVGRSRRLELHSDYQSKSEF